MGATEINKRISFRGVGILVFGVLLAGLIWKFGGISSEARMTLIRGDHLSETSQSSPPKYTNIAIASGFGFHFDVYLTVAWTIQRMKEPVKIAVYTELPFHHDFQHIIDDYGIYTGPYKQHSDLLQDVTSSAGDGAIDMVILGTCEIDMRSWSDALLRAWDARDVQHKFQLVCIVHNADDTIWQKEIPEWSRRNAIRLLPIAPHVKETFHQMFMDRARSSDPVIRSAGMEHIPVDVHVPVLDVKNLPVLSPSRRLSNAVIQGSFSNDRRDYPRIFSELNQSLHADPYVWGYSPLGDTSPSFLPDTTLDDPPFKLHLVGSGWINVPTELKNIIVFHTNLNYADFYNVMGSMDVCVPAFLSADNRNYKRQASSSIAMCMEVNVPILALRELRNSYTYIDDDRITITRPAVMSEVQALKALRTGDASASAFLAKDPSGTGVSLGSNSRVKHAVDAMMHGGWVRSKEGFDVCKRKVWRDNEDVVRRILRDI